MVAIGQVPEEKWDQGNTYLTTSDTLSDSVTFLLQFSVVFNVNAF